MLLIIFNIFMLYQQLTEFGLSEPQAHVYIAGLELGPCTILQIAKKTKQNRTSLYHTIQQLIDSKLVSVTVSGKKKLYVAEPPETLKHHMQLRMKQLDGVLGELSALTHSTTIKPVIKFYEGLDGIKTVFRNAAQAKEKTLYAIAGIQRLNTRSTALHEFWLNEFAPLRIKNGVFTKLIAPDSPLGLEYRKTDEEKFRETRFVPASSYNFECEMMVHDDITELFVYSDKEQFAVSIKSQSIASTIKMVWQIVWNQAYSLGDKK